MNMKDSGSDRDYAAHLNLFSRPGLKYRSHSTGQECRSLLH